MAISVTFSSMLFEPFARAEIEDRGGEEYECCDGENGVVHVEKDRCSMLRKWSVGNKDFVRKRRK
jgi:hypothetical protein